MGRYDVDRSKLAVKKILGPETKYDHFLSQRK
jgi:hypothetical protein